MAYTFHHRRDYAGSPGKLKNGVSLIRYFFYKQHNHSQMEAQLRSAYNPILLTPHSASLHTGLTIKSPLRGEVV